MDHEVVVVDTHFSSLPVSPAGFSSANRPPWNRFDELFPWRHGQEHDRGELPRPNAIRRNGVNSSSDRCLYAYAAEFFHLVWCGKFFVFVFSVGDVPQDILHRLALRPVNYAHECTFEECLIAQCSPKKALDKFVRKANIARRRLAVMMLFRCKWKLTEKKPLETGDNASG